MCYNKYVIKIKKEVVKMNKPKCLKCGSAIDVQIDDCFDYEVTDNAVLRHYIGNCENCKITLTWTMVYEFKEIIDVQEEE